MQTPAPPANLAGFTRQLHDLHSRLSQADWQKMKELNGLIRIHDTLEQPQACAAASFDGSVSDYLAFLHSYLLYETPECLCLLRTIDSNATGTNNARPSTNTRATNTTWGRGHCNSASSMNPYYAVQPTAYIN